MIKRLWGIRHIRYFVLSRLLAVHVGWCARVGIGYFPQQSDIDYLDRVWDGKA